MITLTIDGRVISAAHGETILQAARKHNIYIPTLCYLSKVSPSGSCRLCLVQVDQRDDFVLACQTPVREGISVQTATPAIREARRQIVQMLCVNHPLACGVCDKSGECELQNKASEFGLTAQPFSAKEQQRGVADWDFFTYDNALCIMCERCARVCNETVGAGALSVNAGGYRSSISYDGALCNRCGDCLSVCPVGAITAKSFKYTANAWELTKTPSTCTKCACGCAVNYETKRGRVVRVTNDSDQTVLCAKGRFGFDADLAEPITNIKQLITGAKSVRIGGDLTNEDALILQTLSQRLGFSITAPTVVHNYAEFLRAYGAVCGENLYNATLEEIERSNTVLIIADSLAYETPIAHFAVNRASLNGAFVAYLSPIDEFRAAAAQTIRYEAGAEEGVLALLLSALAHKSAEPLSEPLKNWLNALDIGNLSAESSVGEEELARLAAHIHGKTTVIIGSELYMHKRFRQIAALLGFLRLGGLDILLVPPTPNALGIALICELADDQTESADDHAQAVSLENLYPAAYGYEGTCVTLSKEVKPINAALKCEGESLAQAAKSLGEKIKWTVDQTAKLPQKSGFLPVKFDDLNGGYSLQTQRTAITISAPEEIAPIGEFNGTVAHFVLDGFGETGVLRGSEQFALAARISDGDTVLIDTKAGVFTRRFVRDNSMKGVIAHLEIFDLEESLQASISYRYESVKVRRRES